MFSWCLLPLVARLGAPIALLPLVARLVPFPEEWDKKGITSTLYIFSLVSLRAFVSFRTCNPLVHVFHFV